MEKGSRRTYVSFLCEKKDRVRGLLNIDFELKAVISVYEY